MKVFLSICMILALSFEASAVKDTTDLFIQAWTYQDKFAAMQVEIYEQLQKVRVAVSGVLAGSTDETLKEIEENSKVLLGMDTGVRNILMPEVANECVADLISMLDGVTHIAGVDSAVCVGRYNTNLQKKLVEANDILAQFDLMAGDVQQSVVRSFIGANAFKDPQSIINRFVNAFDSNNDLWVDRKPEIEAFVNELKTAVSALNAKFGDCTEDVQAEYKVSYGRVQSRLESCQEFSSANNVRQGYSARTSFVLEDFLPNRAQWMEE